MLKAFLGVVVSCKTHREAAFKSWKYDFHPVCLLMDWEVFYKHLSHSGSFFWAALWEDWGERNGSHGSTGRDWLHWVLLVLLFSWNPHFHGIWKQTNHSSGILRQPEAGTPRSGFWFLGNRGQVKAVGKSRNGACGEEQGVFPRFGAPMGNTGVFCALISPSWGMPEPRIVQKKGFFPGERPREISAYSWEGAGRGTCWNPICFWEGLEWQWDLSKPRREISGWIFEV